MQPFGKNDALPMTMVLAGLAGPLQDIAGERIGSSFRTTVRASGLRFSFAYHSVAEGTASLVFIL